MAISGLLLIFATQSAIAKEVPNKNSKEFSDSTSIDVVFAGKEFNLIPLKDVVIKDPETGDRKFKVGMINCKFSRQTAVDKTTLEKNKKWIAKNSRLTGTPGELNLSFEKNHDVIGVSCDSPSRQNEIVIGRWKSGQRVMEASKDAIDDLKANCLAKKYTFEIKDIKYSPEDIEKLFLCNSGPAPTYADFKKVFKEIGFDIKVKTEPSVITVEYLGGSSENSSSKAKKAVSTKQ